MSRAAINVGLLDEPGLAADCVGAGDGAETGTEFITLELAGDDAPGMANGSDKPEVDGLADAAMFCVRPVGAGLAFDTDRAAFGLGKAEAIFGEWGTVISSGRVCIGSQMAARASAAVAPTPAIHQTGAERRDAGAGSKR